MKLIWKEVRIDRVREDMSSILLDTQDGIKTTLIVANNELKYNCEVNYLPGEISDVYVNGGQINQVILNIIINAVYAIKEKFNNEKGLIIIKTYEEDENVLLSIEDNGCGMDEKTIRKIFEPFFTTKPVGQGMDFGIIFPIVEAAVNIAQKYAWDIMGNQQKFENDLSEMKSIL